MSLFIKSRARRVERHQQKLNPLGAKLAAALPTRNCPVAPARPPAAPEDTARNRKLLTKKANYQGHQRPGMATRVSVTGCTDGEGVFRGCHPNSTVKIARESYDDTTFVSVIRAS